MEYNYEIMVRPVEGGHQWVMYSKEQVAVDKFVTQDICFSPVFKTESKAVIEALLHGQVFGVAVNLPEQDTPKRHLRLIK